MGVVTSSVLNVGAPKRQNAPRARGVGGIYGEGGESQHSAVILSEANDLAMAREVTDAFQHLMRLRLVHQLGQIAREEEPDNYISPSQLSRADALLLRDAMKTVARVQAEVRERFATDFVAA